MRSFMVSSVVAVMAVMTLVAGTGHADINASKTSATTRPKIELAPTVRVVGFRRAPGPQAAYTGGALALAVDVENTSNGPSDVNVKLTTPSGATIGGLLTVPAHSTRYLTLQDAEGLASSCEAKPYTIALSGVGASAGVAEAPRKGRVVPSCTFSSTLEETWTQMTPDHVEAEKTGNVYLTSPSIVSQASCGKAPSLKVRVVSHATTSSPSIIVQAKEWTATAPVKAQTAAAFPIAPNEQKDVLLTPVPSANPEPASKMKLGITDWTKSLGGHTSDGGIIVHTSRSCTLDVGLLN